MNNIRQALFPAFSPLPGSAPATPQVLTSLLLALTFFKEQAGLAGQKQELRELAGLSVLNRKEIL